MIRPLSECLRSSSSPSPDERKVTTSITSSGDGIDKRSDTIEIQKENECLKWHNAQRGYVMCEVTRDQWTTEFKTMDYVSKRGGAIKTRKRMAIAQGQPGSLAEA